MKLPLITALRAELPPKGKPFFKALILAFPPGGKCRRTATNEGRILFSIENFQ